MPICAKCGHTGEGHNWISSACSRCSNRGLHCPFCFERYERRRKRGQCRDQNCRCAAYKPLTSRPAPVNKYLGLVFPHKDNGGFNIMLQAFPLDGKIVCREITAEEADDPVREPRTKQAVGRIQGGQRR
jgi:hypothetical protein